MSILSHGDCNEILPTISDESIDLIVTDPPYGMSYKSNRQKVDRKTSVETNKSVSVRAHYFAEIENDDQIPTAWLKDAYRVLKPNSAIYVFVHWSTWSTLENAVKDVGFTVKNMIVLNKSNHGMGDLQGQYAPQHELLLFAVKGRHVCHWSRRSSDVWNVPVKFSGGVRLHPNEKPVAWIRPAIANSSKEGDTVLDPFMGSATTGVVCVNMGRKFIGVEKDIEHFVTAKGRIAQAEMTESTMVS